MKNIEIITTQNVVLMYEAATLRDRIFAFLLDSLLLWISLSFLYVILLSITGGAEIPAFIVMIIFLLYSLVMEVFNNGRSVGKMALKLQVIKVSGGQATFSDYASRWVFRMIDIYFSLGGIASMLIASSAKAQRLGDIIANTTVVKTTSQSNINLNELLSIHSTGNYVPKYPQARKLQEQDALLIKNTLDRYRRFGNNSHHDALMQITQRVQEILGLPPVTSDYSTFLQTVLKDYVILTR